MTDQESSFLRAIIAETYTPGAVVAPAMIYADWLDEERGADAGYFWRKMQHPRTAAFHLLLFGKVALEFDASMDELLGAGSGWLVHDRSNATSMSATIATTWVNDLTKATGVQFTRKLSSAMFGNWVLTVGNVYVCMGDRPNNSLIV